MEQKQRVLIVHNFYKIPGGEDTVVENERTLLEEHGHQVFLYTRSNKEMETLSAMQKLLLPFTSLFSLRTYREVKRQIKEKKIDIVHVHNTLSLVSPSVYYAAFSCGKPVVQTVHNFRLLCPAATFLRGERVCEECVEKGLRCAVRYGCYRGSRIQTLMSVLILKLHRFLGTYKRLCYICLTDFNKEKLMLLNQGKRIRIKEEQVFVKPNFVRRPQIKETEKKKFYLYVGRLEKLKGIQVLMEAWEVWPEKELLLCGSGPEEGWVRTYLDRHSMSGVKLLGQRSHEEVLRLLAQSRALILPSICYEGQPMTILESYSVGTPVIASDIGNAGNMVSVGTTGLKFSCGDVKSLRDAVRQMDMERKWDTISTYREIYTAEANYEALRKIYGECQKHLRF